MQLNLLDYFIILILLLSALAGYRQGLLDAVGGILSIVLGLIMAVAYRDELGLFLENQYGLGTFITEFLRERMPLLAFSLNTDFLGKGMEVSPWLTDPASYLARILLLAFSFLLLFIAVSMIIKLIFNFLSTLFSIGGLDWINRVSGMVLVVVKNLLLMVLLTGIFYPVINLAAKMGSNWAIITGRSLSASFLVPFLLEFFTLFKALLGISV